MSGNLFQGRRISNIETNSCFSGNREAVWHSDSNDFSPSWAMKWTLLLP
jgi:hypothetical protein